VRPEGLIADDGEVVFEVMPDATYLVSLTGAGHPFRPVEVYVPLGSSRNEVTLNAEEPDPTGELLLSVTDLHAQPLTDRISIRIEDPLSGTPLLVKDRFWRDTWPLSLSLPTGSYRVVVDGAALIESHHGTLMDGRAHGRFEETVDIIVGKPARLEARLPQGARLALRVNGKVREDDRRAVQDRWPLDEDGVEYWAELASTALVANSRWPVPVKFRYEMTGTSAAGTHLRSCLALETEGVSEILPAGRFQLVGRLPGGRTMSVPVELVDGQTTKAELVFAD
jgi:hypothetical protein